MNFSHSTGWVASHNVQVKEARQRHILYGPITQSSKPDNAHLAGGVTEGTWERLLGCW